MSFGTLGRAIYGKLAGDSTLTSMLHAAPTGFSQSIYMNSAPSEAGFPYIIIQQLTGTPTYSMEDGKSAMEDELWQVKGVVRSTENAVLDGIVSRSETLLADATLSLSGGALVYCRRENAFGSFDEQLEGTTYKHGGSVFRLIYTPT